MINLKQTLSQKQSLKPYQMQLQKILQMNSLALEQRIKTELEANPILEEIQEDNESQETPETDSEIDNDSVENENSNDDEFTVEDFMNDDEFEVQLNRLNKSPDQKYFEPVAPDKETITDHLLEQLHLLDLREDLYILGEEIIGNLDEDGYLNSGLMEIITELKEKDSDRIKIDEEEAEKLLKKIQTFDPIGIASRSLQECLIVQVRHKNLDPYYSHLAVKLLTDHFDDFVNKRYSVIQNRMKLSEETLRKTLELVQKLDPKPGEGNTETYETNQITPDIFVEKQDDNFIITLNDRSSASLTINKKYLDILKSKQNKRKISKGDKKLRTFLREKYVSANLLIYFVRMRKESMLKVMGAIVEMQRECFERGIQFFKPMKYQDIADIVGMDVSSIGRIVNGKYVQSPIGIHEMKYFFSKGVETETGETVSRKIVLSRLREIIGSENKKKPYSDAKLTEILNSEGYNLARRTVAKYREMLKIPVVRLRKQL